MKVILNEDIENLGKKWEVIDVAPGYARNYLIPKKMVKLATPKDIEKSEQMHREEESTAQRELENIEKTVERLDGYEVRIQAKVGDDGQLYAQVSPQMISSSLLGEGFDISKNQIKIKDSIKALGEFTALIEFDHGLEAEIKVIVEAQS